jgi:hypothetical protein
MKCTIDRVEEGIAVLVPQDEPRQRITVPAILLPTGSREGDVLTLTIDRDPAATAAAMERVSGLIEKLTKKP